MSRASLCQLLHRARGQCRLLWSHRVKTSKQCHHNFQETVNYWVCWRFNSDLALKSQIVLLVEVNALQLSVIQDEKDISSKLLEKSDKTCWVKNLSLVETLLHCAGFLLFLRRRWRPEYPWSVQHKFTNDRTKVCSTPQFYLKKYSYHYRKSVKSLKNLGKIQVVINFRPDYRSESWL